MFPFKTALNASTLFPFQLDVIQQIEVTKQAGYQGIELWIRDIEAYLVNGGTIQSIQAALEKENFSFMNAIAFFKWADADRDTREKALIQAEKEMKLLASLGCASIAAPPFGNVKAVRLDEMARYFERLVQLGREIGVEPILEFWGKAEQLSTLNEAQLVMEKSNVKHPKVLIDPFHMYIGGSDFTGLSSLQANQIGIVHVNDYPASPPREKLEDRDRVFPGDGICPTAEMARMLAQIGYKGFVSLELFIEDYEGKSALEIAAYGLKKMKHSYLVD
ncbi:sugar phosphate isomerase/epimerase [Lederbergia sp. NSJ-179]|uniref:sugar phosphate isomerase/epimerase family protein n=1 Tax=Lederbergia sp. NSJ-179 TaxID=2931402 RepID=UPI001FD4B538|nr:sugar phosphate isomerase/epimerase family protein [Lederbergia sp. NSJ-179]MCJ7842346.1 sugar phosphate isomerase/epimerase [Lederbergia sp. NSJ-179]